MSDSQLLIEKAFDSAGWATFTIRIPRPEPDTDDYRFEGDAARDRIAIYFTSYVQGMLRANARDDIADELEVVLGELFMRRHGATLPLADEARR